MAYGAVVSLLQTLEDILHPHMEEQQIHHDKEQIISLQETLEFFRDKALKVSWQRSVSRGRYLEKKIRDSTNTAQDKIESDISKGAKKRVLFGRDWFLDFEEVNGELNRIKEKASNFLELGHVAGQHRIDSLPTALPQSRQAATNNDNTLIGFADDFLALKEQLFGGPPKLQTIALIGMGGSGKTTLAERLYNDSSIPYCFDACAWVTISQNYHVRDIILGLLDSMRMLTDKSRYESDDQLLTCLYQRLKGRRYMIVLDNMWHREVWDEVRRVFPDDSARSRIMITTRISDVAHASSHVHRMRLLREHESLKLLCHKVFREDNCPQEFDKLARKIVKICKGLPLAVSVIGGLVLREKRIKNHLESFMQNFNSFANLTDVPIFEILSASYTHLPPHLKPCFLYVGLFPENHEIRVSTLIKHWVAEGFIEPNSSKSLEEVAEGYLEDLISRSLILACEKRFNGKLKTCVLHDIVRELCLLKAKQEKFLDYINFSVCASPQGRTCTRRLSIYCNHGNNCPSDIFKSTRTYPFLRSLIYTGQPCFVESDDCCSNELLRVLDLSKADIGTSMDKFLMLVHLRYLAFSCSGDIRIPNALPNILWHLQTIIIHQRSDSTGFIFGTVYLPTSIWKMTQLRHLQFQKATFPSPWKELKELQTLLGVSSSSCTKELFDKVPNLKKLRIRVEQSNGDDAAAFSLHCVANFSQLEILKIVAEPGSSVSVQKKLILPQMLKQLTLNNTKLPWEDMSIFGALPNLQVLKLWNNAFQGEEWETIDGGFSQLRCLLIQGTNLQYWRVDDKDHFPKLRELILWECYALKEIPCTIGEIDTIELIDLDDASPPVVASANKIKQDHQEIHGDDHLLVCVLKIQELRLKGKENQREFKTREEEEKGNSADGQQGWNYIRARVGSQRRPLTRWYRILQREMGGKGG